MMVIIDNYDSFTYNLVQYFGELGADMLIFLNDAVTIDDLEQIGPDRIVISPGPGTPDDAGISLKVIEKFEGRVPLLGVCLGHQAIGQFYGASIVRAPVPVHGKPTIVEHDGLTVFTDVPQNFAAGRYHSLVVEESSVPAVLEISARSSDGLVMGLRNREKKVEGVQFHPESILTEHGKKLLQNFLSL